MNDIVSTSIDHLWSNGVWGSDFGKTWNASVLDARAALRPGLPTFLSTRFGCGSVICENAWVVSVCRFFMVFYAKVERFGICMLTAKLVLHKHQFAIQFLSKTFAILLWLVLRFRAHSGAAHNSISRMAPKNSTQKYQEKFFFKVVLRWELIEFYRLKIKKNMKLSLFSFRSASYYVISHTYSVSFDIEEFVQSRRIGGLLLIVYAEAWTPCEAQNMEHIFTTGKCLDGCLPPSTSMPLTHHTTIQTAKRILHQFRKRISVNNRNRRLKWNASPAHCFWPFARWRERESGFFSIFFSRNHFKMGLWLEEASHTFRSCPCRIQMNMIASVPKMRRGINILTKKSTAIPFQSNITFIACHRPKFSLRVRYQFPNGIENFLISRNFANVRVRERGRIMAYGMKYGVAWRWISKIFATIYLYASTERKR